MQVTQYVTEMDEMVSKGQILDAINKFFANQVETQDFDGTHTADKAAMVEKMTGFLNGIQTVNGITHHFTIVGDNVSASEFTFDFDMKDGSKVLWHEIIRRKWKDGKVVNEQYFKN